MPATDTPSRLFADTAIDRIRAVPVPIYGAALALLGAHLLISFVWPPLGHHALVTACRFAGTIAWLGALGVHALKLLLAPQALANDLAHPGVGLFFGQIGVATSLMSEAYGHGDAALGFRLYICSLLLAALALVHIGWTGVGRRAGWRDASPSWLLPGIQWLYLGLLSTPHVPQARVPALALGSVLAVAAMMALGLRALRGPAWPAPVKPALAICVVPPSLGLLAALQAASSQGVADGILDPLQALLFILTLLPFAAALVAVAIAPRPWAQPFRVSWWAYGMPMSAAAIAFHALSQSLAQWTGPSPWLAGLAQGAAFVALGLTAGLSVAGLRAAWRFFLPPPSH